MKLSEAIRLNGMTKEQGFGGASMYSVDAPCALGGALQSVGAQILAEPSDYPDAAYKAIWRLWPWTKTTSKSCPCCCGSFRYCLPYHAIYHLNDTHRWPRERIAEWVATVEPQDTPQFRWLPEQVCEMEATLTTSDAVAERMRA